MFGTMNLRNILQTQQTDYKNITTLKNKNTFRDTKALA